MVVKRIVFQVLPSIFLLLSIKILASVETSITHLIDNNMEFFDRLAVVLFTIQSIMLGHIPV
jgi:predicted membrane protein